MSQNGGNGEQVEVATRTAVAAAIVSSTALYLIYKKKLVRRPGYGGAGLCPANFNRKCWKNPKFYMLVLLVALFCVMCYKRDDLPSVNVVSDLAAAGKRQEEIIHRKGGQRNRPDPGAHPLRHNPHYHPQPQAPRHYGW